MDFATRNDVMIARRGDLMTNMTLEIDLKPNNLSMNCDYDTMATELEDIVYLAQKHQRAVTAGSITTASFCGILFPVTSRPGMLALQWVSSGR